jgi:hypothetical protein
MSVVCVMSRLKYLACTFHLRVACQHGFLGGSFTLGLYLFYLISIELIAEFLRTATFSPQPSRSFIDHFGTLVTLSASPLYESCQSTTTHNFCLLLLPLFRWQL